MTYVFVIKKVKKNKFPPVVGCEDCMQAYKDECPTHRVTCIQDKVVMTRAWASLPNQVHIFRVTEAQMGPEDSGEFFYTLLQMGE